MLLVCLSLALHEGRIMHDDSRALVPVTEQPSNSSVPQLPAIPNWQVLLSRSTAAADKQMVPYRPRSPPKSYTARSVNESISEKLRRRMKLSHCRYSVGNRMNAITQWPVIRQVEVSMAKSSRIPLHCPTARPPLALSLEAFIRREVQDLQRDCPTPGCLQIAPIYREALSCFANHFQEYSESLSLILKHYDQTIGELSTLQQRTHKLQTEYNCTRELYRQLIDSETQSLRNELSDMRATLKEMHRQDSERRVSVRKQEVELTKMKEMLNMRASEADELNDRVKLLASAIREQAAKSGRTIDRNAHLELENENLKSLVSALEFEREEMLKDAVALPAELMSPSSQNLKSPSSQNLKSPQSAATSEQAEAQDQKMDPQILDAARRATVRQESRARHQVIAAIRGVMGAIRMERETAKSEKEIEEIDGEDTEEQLRDVFMELEERITKLARANRLLHIEQAALVKRLEKLQRSVDDDTLTPRPRWISAQETLPDFQPNLSSSQEILDELLLFFQHKLRGDQRQAETKALSETVRQWLGEEGLMEGDLVTMGRNFVGKGTGPHVPEHLRWHGNVRNRRLRKGDVEILLQRFWQDRRRYLDTLEAVVPMPITQFLHEWLCGETESPTLAVELGYCIQHVCESNQYDPDCLIFLRVVKKEISELTIIDQFDMVDQLKQLVATFDPEKTGRIPRLTLQRALNKFFPSKSVDDMLKLRFALISFCHGSDDVNYVDLFAEDTEGNQSKFVTLIRTQHLQEVTSFNVDLEEALRECSFEDVIEMHAARVAVKYLDPAIPKSKIDEVFAFGCQLSVEEFLGKEQEGIHVDCEQFVSRIRSGVLIKRCTPKIERDEDGPVDQESDDEAAGTARASRREEIAALMADVGGLDEGKLSRTKSSIFETPVLLQLRKKAKKKEKQERRVSAAEREVIQQQQRNLHAKEKELENLKAFERFSERLGIGKLSAEGLRVASEQTKQLAEKQQSGEYRFQSPARRSTVTFQEK